MTKKQQQVLDLMREGHKPAAIADKMNITPGGVYGHIRKMRADGVALPGQTLEAEPDAPLKTTTYSTTYSTVPVHASNGTSLIVGDPEQALRDTIASLVDESDLASRRLQELHAEVSELENRIAEIQVRRDKYENALAVLA